MDSLKQESDQEQQGYQAQQDNKEKGRLFFSGMMAGLTVALLIVSVVYLGTRVQKKVAIKNFCEQNDFESAVLEEIPMVGDSAITSRMIHKLQTLEKVIDQYFYLDEVSEGELEDGIYHGMMSALDDPYTEYYSAEELTNLINQTQGVYYGIGAYVGIDSTTTLPRILGIIENTPAQEAGLRANDIIYEVDGTSTYGLSLTEAVAMIKGEEGTEVVLTIIREGETGYLEVPVTRRRVESPTVHFEMLDDDMAYIQITEFDDVTTDQFTEALAMAKGSDMKGLILDLRANPGGNLNTVVDIARMLLPEGLIVYTEDKNGKRTEYSGDGTHKLDVPLVVLVDMNSASASEILAGAVQDYEIGTLVGTTTFGKGIVQQVIPFQDGSAVKLTISSYFTPKGRNIHGVGIEPDITVEFDGETYYNTEDHYDNQLEKAKEVLKENFFSPGCGGDDYVHDGGTEY